MAKKICSITLLRVSPELIALGFGYNPKSTAGKMAEIFTERVLSSVKFQQPGYQVFLSMIISAVENLKLQYPELDAKIRHERIEFLKKNRPNGN